MDKNTIIAIVLSVIVLIVGMTLQSRYIEEVPESYTSAENEVVSENSGIPAEAAGKIHAKGVSGNSESFVVDSGAYSITFEPAGAGISSIKVTNMTQNGEEVEPFELVYREEGDIDVFTLYAAGEILDDVYDYTITENQEIDSTIVTFVKEYESESGVPFFIEKMFAIPKNGEYMIQVAIRIYTTDGRSIPLGSGGGMYSVSIGPQIGPEVTQKNNYDYRRIEVLYADKNKKSQIKYKNGEFETEDDLSWASLSGKYFTFIIGNTDNNKISLMRATQEAGSGEVYQKNVITLERAAERTDSVTDIYTFYAGPKVKKNLSIYNEAKDNAFRLSGLNLNKVLDGSSLGWLQTILNWILQFFYKFVHNYGIAIILLTILIKILLQPLTKKSTESTAKMGALAPKVEEIKAKFPDNPEQQNAAMAKLYKEEGINPMGSCLPLLIQFPIFIALYGLLNNSFDLRGSMFIPGWIPDLSIPDTIFNLPFRIPLLGPQVHLLPILYVISMIFSMKINQTGQTQAGQQGMMFFMTYGMPIMFFFIMYNAPSGLLLYWSTVNVISIGQQIIVNKKKKGVYEEEIAERDAEKKAKKDAKKRRR